MLRWGNGFPLKLDYNGLVGSSPGGASVRSESSVALEVITCAKWDSIRGKWRRKAGASAGREPAGLPLSGQVLMRRLNVRRADALRFSCR